MFKQVKVRRISEEVFDQIKTAITDAQLRPGDKLPTERELMAQLGVSRVPIREALKLLENIGFIETRQGDGSYVRSLVADSLRDPLKNIISENDEKLFELLEVRKQIESWSAFHAAGRAKEKDLVILEALTAEMKQCFERGKKPPARLDTDFHLTISQASCNTIQSHLMFTVYDLFSGYFAFLIEKICFNSKYEQAIYNQHAGIFRAVRDREPEAARDAMFDHLTFVEGELKQLIADERRLKNGGLRK